MPQHTIVEEFKHLLTRPDQFAADREAWQRRCEAVLAELPADEAETVVRELQSLVADNRALFEQENQDILERLNQGRNRTQDGTMARRYRDVGKL